MAKDRRKSERTSSGKGGRTYRKHSLPEGVERVRDKYRARWPRLPGEPGSGRYRKGQVTPDLWRAAKEAQEGRERYEKAMAGHKVQRGEWTLAKAMEAVLDECRVKNNSQGTVDFYRTVFKSLKRAWPEGAAPLRSITTAQVEAFRDERMREKVPGKSGKLVSAQTVCHELQVLSRCFVLAIRKGHPGENPVLPHLVTRPTVKPPEPDWFTRQEIVGILDRIRATSLQRVDSEVDADLILLAFVTGLRKSELARLTVGSVRFARGTVSVDGKKRRRVLPIPEAMVSLLERVIAWPERSYLHTVQRRRIAGQGPSFKWTWEGEGEDRFLLPGVSEERRAMRVQTTFQRWQKRLPEKRLHPHALRHSFTDHLHAWRFPEVVVNSLAGHAKDSGSANTSSRRYQHVHEDDRLEAMEHLWLDPPKRRKARDARASMSEGDPDEEAA
jgi:integrase